MSEWKEVKEEGAVIFVNEEVGNVIKTSEGLFIAMIPKVCKLGPFETLEQAQQAAEDGEGLSRAFDNYNLHLTELCKSAK